MLPPGSHINVGWGLQVQGCWQDGWINGKQLETNRMIDGEGDRMKEDKNPIKVA